MSRVYKEYSFKSSGKDRKAFQRGAKNVINDVFEKKPIGIRTPLQLNDPQFGLFKMHNELLLQVSDNLRNLILTNHGERLGLYQFGANLRELTTELTNSDTDGEAMKRISEAASIWMPYVELGGFSSFRRGEDLNDGVIQIGITVTFTVPKISSRVRQIDVVLDTIG